MIDEISSAYGLGLHAAPEELQIYCSQFAGTAYDVPDPATFETILYLARTEGLFVDPCYSGKGFMALLELLRSGKIPAGSNVLYLHTGGLPALYSAQHLEQFSRDLWAGRKHLVM